MSTLQQILKKKMNNAKAIRNILSIKQKNAPTFSSRGTQSFIT
jgi:hypothetical protein